MKVLVEPHEYNVDVGALWAGLLPAGAVITAMTVFGDLIIEADSEVQLLSLTWLSIRPIATVMEEVHWQLQDPVNHGAEWIFPELLSQLPARKAGFVYHFVQPLGLAGTVVTSNVRQLPIADAHHGVKKLWEQVNGVQQAVQRDGPAFGGSTR